MLFRSFLKTAEHLSLLIKRNHAPVWNQIQQTRQDIEKENDNIQINMYITMKAKQKDGTLGK